MNTARQIMVISAATQGWSQEQQLALALEFIESIHINEIFSEFLVEKAFAMNQEKGQPDAHPT